MELKEFIVRAITSTLEGHDFMQEQSEELAASLAQFMPKDWVDTPETMVIQYKAFLALEDLVKDSGDDALPLVRVLHDAVCCAYWLGRRDERLEGILAEAGVGT